MSAGSILNPNFIAAAAIAASGALAVPAAMHGIIDGAKDAPVANAFEGKSTLAQIAIEEAYPAYAAGMAISHALK